MTVAAEKTGIYKFHSWLRKFAFILEIAFLSPIPPECLSDGKKGPKRLVSVDVSTINGAFVWIINGDGVLSKMENIGMKTAKGKVVIEVAPDEEIFVAKSLAEATKKVAALMRGKTV